MVWVDGSGEENGETFVLLPRLWAVKAAEVKFHGGRTRPKSEDS